MHADTVATQSPLTQLLEETSLDAWLTPEKHCIKVTPTVSKPWITSLSSRNRVCKDISVSSSLKHVATSSFVPSPRNMVITESFGNCSPRMKISPSKCFWYETCPVENTLQTDQTCKPKAPLLRDFTNKAADSKASGTSKTAKFSLHSSIKRKAAVIKANSRRNVKRPRSDLTLTATALAMATGRLGDAVSPRSLDGTKVTKLKTDESFVTTYKTSDHNKASVLIATTDENLVKESSPMGNKYNAKAERELLKEFDVLSFYHECQPNCMIIHLSCTNDTLQRCLVSHSSVQDVEHASSEDWRLFEDAEVEKDPLLASLDPSSMKISDASSLVINDNGTSLQNSRFFGSVGLEKEPLARSTKQSTATCGISAVPIAFPVLERVDLRRSESTSIVSPNSRIFEQERA